MNADLEPLEESVRYYEKELERAHDAFERARANLELAERNLAVARSFYDMEMRRLLPGSGLVSRFAGMTLRDACVAVVLEKGRANTSDIARELAAASYDLQTPFPGRAIHAALMHARGVRKVGPGSYEATSSVAG